MKDQQKNKVQLIAELQELRQRISEHESTERYPIESEIKKSEARLRRAEIASKSGNWELHLETQKVVGSEGAAKIYGVNKTNFDYENIKDIPLPEYRPLLDKALKNILSKKEAYDVEYKIKSADTGQIKTIHSIAQYDKENRIVFGVIQDITEYKNIQDAYKESEEKNRILLDLAPDSFFQGDEKGNLIRVNTKASELTGYTKEELLTLNIMDLFTKESLKAKSLRYDLLKKGAVLTTEREILREDGAIVPIEMKSRLMPDNTYQSFFRDIADRKEAEDSLRKSEEQLRLITENTSDNIAITTFDLKATYLYVNPSIKSVLGYEPEDLLGKSFFDFIHPDDKKALFPLLKKYVQQKVKNLLGGKEAKISETIEYRFKNKVGEWRYLQSTVNIIENQLLAVTRDITEHKQAQEILAESENRFRSLFENSQAVMLIIDPKDGKIVDANTAAYSYYGWNRKELLRKKVSEINTLSMIEIHEEMDRALHQKRNHFEFCHRRADGSIRDVEIYSGPVQINQQQLLYSLVFDITERKQIEEALNKSESKYRTLFEKSADAVLLLKDGIIIDCNPATLKMFEYKKKQDLQKQYPSQLSPETQPDGRNSFEKANEMISTALENGSHHFEWAHQKATGEVFPAEVRLTAIPYEQDFALHSVVRDISERKQAEDVLKENIGRQKLVLNSLPIVFYTVDPNDDMPTTWISEQFETLTGYKTADILSDHQFWTNRIHHDDKEQTLAEYFSVLDTGYIETVYRWKIANGSYKWFQDKAILLRDENQKPNQVIGLWIDITERKQAEEKLLDNENRMRLIVEGTPYLFFYTQNTKGELTYISPSVEKITGRSVKDWLNQKDWFITDSKINDSAKEATWNHLRGEVTKGSILIEIEHADKRPILLEIYENPIFDEGKVIGLQGVAHDVTQRKQVEERIRESEERFRLAFHTSPDAITISCLSDGKYIDVNQGFTQISGFTREDAIGKSALDLNIWNNADERAHFAERLKKDGVINNLEAGLQIKNGDIIYGLLSAAVMQYNREPVILTIARDITDRKRIEEALHKSENKYRTLFEKSADAILIIKDNKFVDCNSATIKMLGYAKKKDFLDTHPSQLSPEMQPDGRSSFEKADEMMATARENGSHRFEWIHKRRNGELFPVEVLLTAIPFEDGNFIHVVWRDITERKRTEEALLMKDFAVASSINAIAITDLKGSVIYVNDATLKMWGYKSSDELLGKSLLEFWEGDGINQTISDLETKGFRFGEDTGKRKDGSVFFVQFSASIVKDTDGNPKYIFGSFIDISQSKQADEDKAKLETQLRRSQKMETIGTLAGGIAHDFNNILAPIMGFTELAMLKLDETAPIAKDLKQVLKGVHRAKELVEQILLFSKQTEKERQPISLQASVTEALKLLRPSIPTTIEIKHKLEQSCPNVWADATQIHQVLVNLCTNAMQAMAEKGGKLSIELSQLNVDATFAKIHPNLELGTYALLSIIDTGPGMDEATLERIFEPFFTTKTVDKGTGLGLSVVHGIVRSHKGDIQVTSAPGRGTAFHIYLPATVSEQQVTEKKSGEVQGGSESILIVDDESDIGEMVQVMLENFGYKSEVHNNAQIALDRFKKQPDKFDLLISDLTMPQMTGLDLADQLHEERPDLPVIIMTGYGDSLTQPTQKRYSIKHVLSKPVAVKELAMAVRRVLDDSKSEVSKKN